MPDIRSTALPTQHDPAQTDRLGDLHDAADRVREAWERLTVVRDGDDADDSRSSRRYMAALWQVQSAEEDYLRLRERLLGA